MTRLLFAPTRAARFPARVRVGANAIANAIVAPRPQWFCCHSRCHSSSCVPSNLASLFAQAPQPSSQQQQQLTIHGFVRTVRKQKRIAFAAIGDGSTLHAVQAVLTPEQAEGLSTGAAVAITGTWASSPGREQSYELQADSVRLLGQHDAATYPLQKKYHTPDFLRTLPHLRSRLPLHSLILRLRSQVTAQVTNYFASHDFVQTHPPIITSSDCEGAGEVFTIAPEPSTEPTQGLQRNSNPREENQFFGSPKYLTVSSQLHLEALAQSVDKVWTLSPTFRAEKSDTARHLSEFYMLEAEVAFTDKLSDVMDVVEDMLRTVATTLKTSHVGRELLEARARDPGDPNAAVSHTTLARRWDGLIDGPWPRITFENAIKHLNEAVAHGGVQFEFPPCYEEGLQTEHERYLAESVGHGSPVFVTDYPRGIKPFYMSPSSSETAGGQTAPTAACFDLLVPDICELVGGSLREHRLPELLESMQDHGLQPPSDSEDASTSDGSLQWYLDLRRYGSVPHGGFGMGYDRLLCYLSGVANIRDVVSFPRWYKRCDC